MSARDPTVFDPESRIPGAFRGRAVGSHTRAVASCRNRGPGAFRGWLLAGLLVAVSPACWGTLRVTQEAGKGGPAASAPATPAAPSGAASGAGTSPVKPAGKAKEPPASRREEAPSRPRTNDAPKGVCSDALVEMSLGTLSPDEIERLRQKGCALPGAPQK